MRVCVFMQRILLQRPLDGAIQLWSQWAKFDSCSRIGSSQWWTRLRRLWCPILKRIIILNWFFSVICSNRFAKCGTHSAGTVRWVTKWELLTLYFVKELINKIKFHIMGAKGVVTSMSERTLFLNVDFLSWQVEHAVTLVTLVTRSQTLDNGYRWRG